LSIDIPTVAVITCLIILIVLLCLFLRKKKALTANARIKKIVDEYQRDEIKSFIIPDGIGGLIEIEHLVLLDKGLLLIEHYPISGNLFGAEKIDLWTQIVDGRSYKFANPLRHIRTQRQAIKALLPNIPIFCRVIFTADSIFPKGKPEEVSIVESLDEDLQFLRESPNVINIASQWERLTRIARKDGQAVQRGEAVDG
jgi:hypothetical protein